MSTTAPEVGDAPSSSSTGQSSLSESGRQSVAKLVEMMIPSIKARNMSGNKLEEKIKEYQSMSNRSSAQTATLIAYLMVYRNDHSILSWSRGYTNILDTLKSQYKVQSNN